MNAGRIGGFQDGSALGESAQGGGKPRPYYIRSMSYGCSIGVQGEHTCLEHAQTLGCSFCFVGNILGLLFS